MNKLFKFLTVFICLATLVSSCTISPTPKQYAVESDFIDGEMTIHEGPGVKDAFNVLDAVTYYDKVDGYSFSAAKDEANSPIEVRFANNNIGYLSGYTDYRLPAGENKKYMLDIEENYGSPDKVEQILIRQALEKSAFTAGQFMNIFDALSKNRSFLREIIFDQANNGEYQVTFKEEKVKDVATGEEKVIKVSDRIACNSGNNCIAGYLRTEQSALKLYGIELFNFTIKGLKGEPAVETAIEAQLIRSNKMEDLAIEAREAQVKAATTAENAKAQVAEANAQKDIDIAKAQAKTAVKQEEVKQAQAEADAELARRRAEAKGDKLKKAAGLSPERAAYWKFRSDSVISANSAKAPVPSIVNASSSEQVSSLQQTYGMERSILLIDQLQKRNQNK